MLGLSFCSFNLQKPLCTFPVSARGRIFLLDVNSIRNQMQLADTLNLSEGERLLILIKLGNHRVTWFKNFFHHQYKNREKVKQWPFKFKIPAGSAYHLFWTAYDIFI